MKRLKVLAVTIFLAMAVVGTLGISVPSASAQPLNEPDLLACAQVIGALMEYRTCLMLNWEACMDFLLGLGLGLTAEQIEVCGEYIQKGVSKALCELNGWTWFEGDPPLCIPCGKPGYDCYTFVVGGGGGEEVGGHHPEQQDYIDVPGWGSGGGGWSGGWGGGYNGWIAEIPNGLVSNCWYVYDGNGRLIASGCN